MTRANGAGSGKGYRSRLHFARGQGGRARPAGGRSLEMSEIADLRARNRDIRHLGAGRRRRRRPEELIVLIEVVDPAERVLEVAVVRDHGQHAGEVEHPLDGRVLGDTEQVQPAVDPVVVA